MIRAAQPASWWPVGSSAMRSRGRRTSARASAIRCCSPSDVSFGYLDLSSVNPSAPIRSSTTERCSASTTGHPSRILHVLLCGELLHQTETLRHHRDVGPIRRPLPRRVHRPRVRRLPAGGDVQQRGLSGPRAADQADDLTGARFEAHSSERMHGLVALAVRLVDVHQPHDGLVVEPPDRAVGIRPPQLRCRRDVRRMRRVMGRPADAAVFQLEPFVGHRHHGRIVCRQQERDAFGGERPHSVEHTFARRVIELRGGFVRDDDAGARRDRLGERGALLFSARQLGGQMIHPVADAQEVEQPRPDRVRWNRGHVSRDADALRRSDAPGSCPRDVGRCSRRGRDGGVAAPSPIRDRRHAPPRRASPSSAGPCRRSIAAGTTCRFRKAPRSPSRHLGGTGT